MVTIANADQSFEYHIQLEQIYEIAFVEKVTPNKTLRIVRLMNENGDSITSFILVDGSNEAQKWFADLIQRHGNVVRLFTL
jgi:putative heme iron utilization protein